MNASAPLWTTDAMAGAMRAARCGPLPRAITGISIDSRTVLPGEVYFAIRGETHDGHDFVGKALEAGAGLAVVDKAHRAAFADDTPLLVVADVLDALRDLGRAARARTDARVIAVTGSVGKTSTKEALRLALGASGATHASVASFNNHWGVPLTLARCPQDAKFAMFEIGMNHAGEIAPLVEMVRPHIAIITTIEPVHLEFFESVEAIADAKAEIFCGLEPGGVAILNRDNPQFARLSKHAKAAGVARVVTFGTAKSCDVRLIDAGLHDDCSTVRARLFGENIAYKLGVPGRHMVINSLAALAAISLAGADLAMALLALAQMRSPPGRGVRSELGVGSGRALLIDESYNANPASMRAALALLGQVQPAGRGRRIAVLGDMLELGAQSGELHAGLAEAVAASSVDLVFCCGPMMRNLWDALPASRKGGYARDSEQLERDVLAAVQPDDAIMVKGSLGSRMKVIVAALEREFARRETLAAETGR